VYYRQEAAQEPEEATMETLLLIIGIAAAALLLVRPAPRPQIIYVPVEVVEERGGLGCLPLIVVGIIMLLLMLLALGGTPS